MRVYVAGPYTQGDTGINVHRAIEVAQRLLENGHVPFVPHLYHLWHLIFPGVYEQWIMLDLEWLKVCQALIRLPGHSPGADKEVAEALRLGITVYYSVDDFLLKNADPAHLAPPAPEGARIPVRSDKYEIGFENIRSILNLLIYNIGPDLAIVSWSNFPERVCRICRGSWQDHRIDGGFQCPEAMKILEGHDGQTDEGRS